MTEVTRSNKGLFVKGQSGNPSGRAKTNKGIAIELIYKVFLEHKEQFESEMEKEASKDIKKFYHAYLKDLQPKNIELDANITAQLTLTEWLADKGVK